MTCGGKDSSNLWHGLVVEEMLVDDMWGKDSSNLWHGLVVEEMLVDDMWGGGKTVVTCGMA